MKTIKIFIASALLLVAQTSSAISLSFNPAAANINTGDSVAIDLMIHDLGATGAPSLGAFYLSVGFDNTVVGFDSVDYAGFLGNTDPAFFETSIATTVNPDNVELDNFSFLFDFELDALQSADFLLATLNFTGINTGSSDLQLSVFDLSDALGNDITSGVSTSTGLITVNQSAVPLPSLLTLLLAALVSSYLGRAAIKIRS